MKGKLPITERIVLESSEDAWKIQMKGLIKELKTTGVIEVEPGKKVRINIVLDKIISPKEYQRINVISFKTNFQESFSEGIRRSSKFLADFFDKSTWFLFGYIDGDQKIPLVITYIQSINIAVYTQKLKNETIEIFYPSFPQLN